MSTKWWHFSQNNSGGSFDFDEDKGITHHVVIEALNKDQASARAQDLGIYFDGVREGMDCGCCGDRWHEPWDDKGDDSPKVYDQPADKYETAFGQWMKEGYEIAVHPLKGPFRWHGVVKISYEEEMRRIKASFKA